MTKVDYSRVQRERMLGFGYGKGPFRGWRNSDHEKNGGERGGDP